MDTDQSKFIPWIVLKVYKQGTNSKYYIEIHNVMHRNTKEIGILGAGRPLQKKTLQRLLGAVNTTEQKSYFEKALLDPRLLACEPAKFKRHILWYDIAKPQAMVFTKDIKLKDAMYSMPALLYFVHLDKIRIFAMKTGNKRPDLNTKLYYAPLLNQTGDGTFCWGSAKTDTSEIEEIDKEMNAWDGFLWNSKFSEHGTALTKLKLSIIYRIVKDSKIKFPNKYLESVNLTVGQLLKKYLS